LNRELSSWKQHKFTVQVQTSDSINEEFWSINVLDKYNDQSSTYAPAQVNNKGEELSWIMRDDECWIVTFNNLLSMAGMSFWYKIRFDNEVVESGYNIGLSWHLLIQSMVIDK